MKRVQKRALQAFTSERFDLDNPFVKWFAAYYQRGAARCVAYQKPGDTANRGCDLLMGDLASRRFSIGVENKMPYLAIDENDSEAITFFNWSQAAFVRKVQSGDWVVLSCKDARIENSHSDEAVPLRLWLPCRSGLLDGFLWIDEDERPKEMLVIESTVYNHQPLVKSMDALKKLPLVFKGNWKEEPEAAA